MKTYQDLLAVEGDRARGEFCEAAVNNYTGSKEYANALVAFQYYKKHNVTIERYQKYIRTLSGNQMVDTFSANYKLKTTIFRRLVLQQVQYVLGNGIVLQEIANKKKLGKDFDFKVQRAAKFAMVCGKSYGFWNYDHLEVFSMVESGKEPGFCGLLDERTSAIKGGIRFWSTIVGDKVIRYYTLYDENGISEYVKRPDEDIELVSSHPYMITRVVTADGSVESEVGHNYDRFPIVELFASDTEESELIGLRENIDCYDLIKSGLANDIDDLSGFFWVLENNGGMDDYDLAKFIQRMKTVRAADVEDGSKAELHTQEVPSEARTRMLEILRKDIYEDFQALDVNTLSAAAKTTQEIQAAYQNQDNKCADFEYYVIDFIQQILGIAQIDDNPTFIWNKVVNMSEQTEMVLSAQNYLPEELIIKHLPFLTPEEADEAIKQRALEMKNQFTPNEEEEEEEEEE